jgi:antitoxin (DNA-binding transcriptional repressor) of toxin-antitoxin stability system
MYHRNVSPMKTASIRDLKHDTTTVLGWVTAGERVEIQRRGKPVAMLSRPAGKGKPAKRPDFAARLRSIYGGTRMAVTAAELLSIERGDR